MGKSLSEEFKDQKINDLLEDYIELEKQIKAIPEQLFIISGSMIKAAENLSSSALDKIKESEAQSLASMEQKQKTLHMEMKAAIREETAVMISQLTEQLKATLDNHKPGRKKTALLFSFGVITGIIATAIIAWFLI